MTFKSRRDAEDMGSQLAKPQVGGAGLSPFLESLYEDMPSRAAMASWPADIWAAIAQQTGDLSLDEFFDRIHQDAAGAYLDAARRRDLEAVRSMLEASQPAAEVVYGLALMALAAGGKQALSDQGRRAKSAQSSASDAAKMDVQRRWLEMAAATTLSKRQFAHGEAVEICAKHKVRVDAHTAIYARWLSPRALEIARRELVANSAAR